MSLHSSVAAVNGIFVLELSINNPTESRNNRSTPGGLFVSEVSINNPTGSHNNGWTPHGSAIVRSIIIHNCFEHTCINYMTLQLTPIN
jgi:hypothetical protein